MKKLHLFIDFDHLTSIHHVEQPQMVKLSNQGFFNGVQITSASLSVGKPVSQFAPLNGNLDRVSIFSAKHFRIPHEYIKIQINLASISHNPICIAQIVIHLDHKWQFED